MAGLLNTLSGLLIYKEKQNYEHGFELLENQNESMSSDTLKYKDDTQNHEHKQASKIEKSSSMENEKGKSKSNKKSRIVKVSCKSKNKEKNDDNNETLSNDLGINLNIIKQKFGIPKNQDFVIREFKIGRKLRAFIVYIEEMIDNKALNLSILPQLMERDVLDELHEEYPVEYLIENILAIHNLKKVNKYNEIAKDVLSGQSALFIEGCSECILIETRGFEKRSIEKPLTETIVMGPQEGFTENLRTNMSLIRRIIKNENLNIELLPVGNTNNSNCAVMYIDGIANKEVIEEVKKRIKSIDSDFVMGSGMIEQFIEDNSFGIWPQLLTTERPDKSASFLVEGQVIIIGEGAPFAIVAPVTFYHLFHSSEDTFLRWPLGNFLRFVRMIGFYMALMLPGIYIAMVMYHPEMIPTELLNSMAQAKETVPFPTIVEVVFMEISFELIREGGIRIPSIIGQTLGIVGALILGQAAVAADLVSPVVIIIVAVDGLCNFVIPNYELALSVRLEKFLLIFAAAFLGFYGLTLVVFLACGITCSMKSFGVPYLSPSAPRTKTNPDIILRTPIWMQKERPDFLNTRDRKRQGYNKKMWISEKDKGNEDGGRKS